MGSLFIILWTNSSSTILIIFIIQIRLFNPYIKKYCENDIAGILL